MPTRPSHRRADPRQRGFTLIEAMTVVAIIGITAALALVYLDSGKAGRSVLGYSEMMANEFSLARQRAIATQKRQRLVIEADGFSHWQSIETGLAQVADPNDPDSWDFVFEKKTPRDVSVVALSSRLHIDANDSVPGAGTGLPFEIDVLPDGRARSVVGGSFFESGWTVFLQDEDDKQVRAVLFGVTGTASVYDGW